MITVSLYAIHPILAAGFRSFMDGIGDIEVPEVYTEIEVLQERIPMTKPDVAVLEVTPAITLNVLAALVSLDVPIILWSNAISTEFASQALAYGVRGMLSTTASRDDYAQCLVVIQSGGLWVERDLGSKLLGHRRVSLSPRQRQLMGLVAKGLRNKEIAYAMGISEGTVKVYMSKLFQRVGVSDRFELALLVLRNLAGDELGATQQVAAARASVGPFPMPAFLTTDRSLRLASGY
jgi:two-component system, NarL family, nitrate/nitrite response regulator NarL